MIIRPRSLWLWLGGGCVLLVLATIRLGWAEPARSVALLAGRSATRSSAFAMVTAWSAGPRSAAVIAMRFSRQSRRAPLRGGRRRGLRGPPAPSSWLLPACSSWWPRGSPARPGTPSASAAQTPATVHEAQQDVPPDVALRRYAFISLLREEPEARALAGLLEGLARAEATDVFHLPGPRGARARLLRGARQRQAAVDRWWGGARASRHPPGLPPRPRGGPGSPTGCAGSTAPSSSPTRERGPVCIPEQWNPVAGAKSYRRARPRRGGGEGIWRYSQPGDGRRPSEDVFDARDVRMISRVRAHATPAGAEPDDPAGPGRAKGPTSPLRATAIVCRVRPHVRPSVPPLFAVSGVKATPCEGVISRCAFFGPAGAARG